MQDDYTEIHLEPESYRMGLVGTRTAGKPIRFVGRELATWRHYDAETNAEIELVAWQTRDGRIILGRARHAHREGDLCEVCVEVYESLDDFAPEGLPLDILAVILNTYIPPEEM